MAAPCAEALQASKSACMHEAEYNIRTVGEILQGACSSFLFVFLFLVCRHLSQLSLCLHNLQGGPASNRSMEAMGEREREILSGISNFHGRPMSRVQVLQIPFLQSLDIC